MSPAHRYAAPVAPLRSVGARPAATACDTPHRGRRRSFYEAHGHPGGAPLLAARQRATKGWGGISHQTSYRHHSPPQLDGGLRCANPPSHTSNLLAARRRAAERWGEISRQTSRMLLLFLLSPSRRDGFRGAPSRLEALLRRARRRCLPPDVAPKNGVAESPVGYALWATRFGARRNRRRYGSSGLPRR